MLQRGLKDQCTQDSSLWTGECSRRTQYHNLRTQRDSCNNNNISWTNMLILESVHILKLLSEELLTWVSINKGIKNPVHVAKSTSFMLSSWSQITIFLQQPPWPVPVACGQHTSIHGRSCLGGSWSSQTKGGRLYELLSHTDSDTWQDQETLDMERVD